MSLSYCDAIRLHYIRAWSNEPIERRWREGPVDDLPPGFSVLEFSPSKSRRAWTYATCCMSQPEDSNAIELHLLSPQQSDMHIELLTAVCHFHRTGSRLGLEHTINFGRPWLNGSRCTYGLVSLPYLDGPSLEDFRYEDNIARCLWLIPITQQERDFKVANSMEALEQRLEHAKFDYLDIARPSVV